MREGVGRSQEKLEDVEVHEQHGDSHGVGQVAIELALLDCVAQHEHAPAHHAHATVCPGLEVKVAANARVQLHAPVVVVNQAARAARVAAARCVFALSVCIHALLTGTLHAPGRYSGDMRNQQDPRTGEK